MTALGDDDTLVTEVRALAALAVHDDEVEARRLLAKLNDYELGLVQRSIDRLSDLIRQIRGARGV